MLTAEYAEIAEIFSTISDSIHSILSAVRFAITYFFDRYRKESAETPTKEINVIAHAGQCL
jgi:hypothetical protein